MELLRSVEDCIEKVKEKLNDNGISLDRIVGVGITNQRETTIVWDKVSGQPLCNAVVWADARNGVEVGISRATRVVLKVSTLSNISKVLILTTNIRTFCDI